MPGTTAVYVASADSKQIFVMSMDRDTGALHVIQTCDIGGTVMPLAISPDGRYLFASLRSTPYSVASLGIDRSNGRLAPIATVPLPDNMAFIATDRRGRFLLSASYTGDKVAINRIGADGRVDPVATQVLATKPHAHAISTDPSNRFVFATCLGGDIVMQEIFDSEHGTIAPNAVPVVALPPKAGPRHFAFSPNGKFFYVLCELDGGIHAYAFDAGSGTLRHLQAATSLPAGFSDEPWAADIHLTPDGRFLYASERTSSTLAAFRVDAQTGLVTPIGSTPTETQPRGFAIDPRGRFLLAAGQISNGLTVYSIDAANGGLTPVHRYETGSNPNWVEILDLS